MAEKFTCLDVYDLRRVEHHRCVCWTRNQHLQTMTVMITKYVTTPHSMCSVVASYDVLYDPPAAPGAAGFFKQCWGLLDVVRLRACLRKTNTD